MDEEWRELERQVPGDVGARTRLLAERLRKGLVPRSRVELASQGGDEAALAVLGEPAPGQSLGDWALSLGVCGKEVAARAALAALELAERSPGGGFRRALSVVRAWLECPCARHVTEAEEAFRHGARLGEEREQWPDRKALAAGWSLRRAAAVLARLPGLERGWVSVVRQAIVSAALALRDEERVRVAAGRVVSAWALSGREDAREARPGERVLNLFGSDVLLPAIMLGWEHDGFRDPRAAPRFEALAPGFAPGVVVNHRPVGPWSRYAEVAGLLLRLESNLDRLGPEAGRLVCGLRAMAEPSRGELLRSHFPVLAVLARDFGDEDSGPRLHRFQELLSGFVPVPQLTDGGAGFVVFEDSPPLEHWEGWTVSVPVATRGDTREYGALENTRDLGFDESRKLDAGLLAELEEWGQDAGAVRAPRAFLVWESEG